MALNTPEHAFARAKDFGMTFQSGSTNAGLSLALGVAETRPVDLVTAYGTLANGGRRVDHTTILTVKDRAGKDIVPPYVPPAGVQVVSPQAACIVTDILNGNTITGQPVLGRIRARRTRRRPPARRRSRPARTTTPRTSTPTATSHRRPRRDAQPGPTPLPSGHGTATATTRRCRPPMHRSSRSTCRPTSGRASCRKRRRKWPSRGFERPPTA